jgi:hypothetical protein
VYFIGYSRKHLKYSPEESRALFQVLKQLHNQRMQREVGAAQSVAERALASFGKAFRFIFCCSYLSDYTKISRIHAYSQASTTHPKHASAGGSTHAAHKNEEKSMLSNDVASPSHPRAGRHPSVEQVGSKKLGATVPSNSGFAQAGTSGRGGITVKAKSGGASAMPAAELQMAGLNGSGNDSPANVQQRLLLIMQEENRTGTSPLVANTPPVAASPAVPITHKPNTVKEGWT